MIISKDKIQRYMRHIIMQEIGGPGQKKLIESAVLVCGQRSCDSTALLYYLVASGISNVDCCFSDSTEFDLLASNLKDLNPDLNIHLYTSYSQISVNNHDVVLMHYASLEALSAGLCSLPSSVSAQIIIAASSNYCGAIKGMDCIASTEAAVEDLKPMFELTASGEVFSYIAKCITGVLSVIEAIKAILGIGEKHSDTLFFNAVTAEFYYGSFKASDALHLVLKNSDKKSLKEHSVFIVGSGGLGSPNAFALANSGIGRIGLIDYDVVEASNLNRQILHSVSRIGIPKVESAKHFLTGLNKDIRIDIYNDRFTADNAIELIKEYDIIVDGLDNLPTRYLLNDACYFMKKPFVEAGVLGFIGLTTKIIPDKGPCYRCTFPETDSKGPVPSCSETGVLGPLPGLMGFLQAAEVIKHFLGLQESLENKLLLVDSAELEFNLVDIEKDPTCVLCGTNPKIDKLKDYEFFCSKKESS